MIVAEKANVLQVSDFCKLLKILKFTFQMCCLVFPLTEMLSFDSFSYSDLVWLSEPGIPGILIRLVWTNYRLAAGKSGTQTST